MASDIAQNLQTAIAHHQSGRLGEAEHIYRQILSRQPDHAEALHLLGMVAQQAGQSQAAADLIQRSLQLSPQNATAWCNLGEVYRSLGRLQDAVSACAVAIRESPCFAEAHCNLGNVWLDLGRTDSAILSYSRALELRQNFPQAYNNLSNALQRQGKFAEAADAASHAIRLSPLYFDAYLQLGNALRSQKQFQSSLQAYAKATELNPNSPQAWYNRANVFRDLKKPEDAIAAYLRALGLKADYAEAFNNLGAALSDLRKWNEAIVEYNRALSLNPNYAEAYSNLGNALYEQDRLAEAALACTKAIELNPALAEGWYNLGNARRAQQMLPEAQAAYSRAVELENHVDSLINLGGVFKDQGALDDALRCFDRVLELQPNNAAIASNRLFTLCYHPAYDAAALLDEHKKWNARFAEKLFDPRPPENDRSPNRRLRIGYVAPDFRDHCQSLFTLPLLSHHDHSQVEVFCYASVDHPDAITDGLRSHTDVWRDVALMDDAELAEQIRRDKIDILIDLTVHMAHNRLLVFARKPAPIQVTWLGYPGMTGLSTMDYRLSDPWLDPPENEVNYSERTIRLPETFWCYDPRSDEPAVNALPALTNGYVTFGCFNNFCKVNDEMIRLWASVMKTIPSSRVLLLAPVGPAREHLLQIMRSEGVSTERVEFENYRPRGEYLKLYHRIDVCLETLPYNGHTTSLDAIWMGVPVATVVGKTVVGRAGLSQLANLHMKQWVAQSPTKYPELVKDMTSDLERLSEVRMSLRDRMKESALMDAKRFARNFETTLRGIWRKWVNS